jgi:hypothetical protein
MVGRRYLSARPHTRRQGGDRRGRHGLISDPSDDLTANLLHHFHGLDGGRAARTLPAQPASLRSGYCSQIAENAGAADWGTPEPRCSKLARQVLDRDAPPLLTHCCCQGPVGANARALARRRRHRQHQRTRHAGRLGVKFAARGPGALKELPHRDTEPSMLAPPRQSPH